MRAVAAILVVNLLVVLSGCGRDGEETGQATQGKQSAQAKIEPLDGVWDFVTVPERGGPAGLTSYMQGSLFISPAPNGSKACSLNANQKTHLPVPGFKWGEFRDSTAQQSCQIIRTGDVVNIQSTVLSSSVEGYTPDNFELTLTSDNQMQGTLQSVSVVRTLFQKRGTGEALPSPNSWFSKLPTFSGQPEGWLTIGEDARRCAIEYKSPVQYSQAPTALRFWWRENCGGTTEDGVEYARRESLWWFTCADGKLYAETHIYLDGNGTRVADWSPQMYGMAVDGPTMREVGVNVPSAASNAMTRVLTDKICA